mmetsp:Transcript_38792/g.119732  ORF Transcript_38792/g.119732 Transcript_38792/m.119732 type:complete len:205 (-) Transcript_38792:3-617(-)
MRQAEAVEDGDGVRHALAAVQHEARGAALAQECQHALDGDVQGGHAEGLEHDLHHPLAVRLGVVRRLCQEDWVLLRVHLELLEERVLPEELHVLEVLDDAVFQGPRERQPVPQLVHLVAVVNVPVQRGTPDLPRPADDFWEDGPGRLIAGEPCLADARAVVHNDHNLLVDAIVDVGVVLAFPPFHGAGLGRRTRPHRRICAKMA